MVETQPVRISPDVDFFSRRDDDPFSILVNDGFPLIPISRGEKHVPSAIPPYMMRPTRNFDVLQCVIHYGEQSDRLPTSGQQIFCRNFSKFLKLCAEKPLTVRRVFCSLFSVMNAYTYPTMEIELDGTTVLVSYRENTSSVQVMDIKPVGNVPKEDMDWVTSHIDIIERMVAKELRPPVQDFDDIGD